MRHRETSEANNYDPVGAAWIEKRPGWPDGTLFTPTGGDKVKEIDDVQTPGFRALQKCGKFLPLNPVVIRTTERSNLPFQGSIVDIPGTSAWYEGEFTWNAIPPGTLEGWWTSRVGPPSDPLINAVRLAAAANAVSEKWDVLTFLAEFSQSVATLHSVGRKFNTKMVDVIKHLKRARKWSADRVWRWLRGEWLEWRYGIRPIVYDFISVYEGLRRLYLDIELVKGKGYQEEEVLWSNVTVEPAAHWTAIYQQKVVGKRYYRGAAYVDIDLTAFDQVSIDPIVTAWELTPYSFVIDKFIDIGAWLSTLLPTLNGDFVGQMYSVKTEVECESSFWLEAGGIHPLPAVVNVDRRSSATIKYVEYVRHPGSGLPPLPGLNPRLTLPFIADLVALFVKGRADTYRAAQRR